MSELIQTMKLHIHPDVLSIVAFKEMTTRYSDACNYISQYIFDNGFEINSIRLQQQLYSSIRKMYGLKSQ